MLCFLSLIFCSPIIEAWRLACVHNQTEQWHPGIERERERERWKLTITEELVSDDSATLCTGHTEICCGRCSEEFPSCWKFIHHPFCQAKKSRISSLQLLFCLLPFISCFFNLSLRLVRVWLSPPLLNEKIKLLLIGGADDHTVSPGLLSAFNSYHTHSTPLTSSLYIWVDICRFISKSNCFASVTSRSTFAICYVSYASKLNFSTAWQQTGRQIRWENYFLTDCTQSILVAHETLLVILAQQRGMYNFNKLSVSLHSR